MIGQDDFNMELKISGLKCDYCQYRDDNVKFSEYKKSIDRKCPECGENLLTKEEYDKCIKLDNRVKIFNNIYRAFDWITPKHYFRLIFGDNRSQFSFKHLYKTKK